MRLAMRTRWRIAASARSAANASAKSAFRRGGAALAEGKAAGHRWSQAVVFGCPMTMRVFAVELLEQDCCPISKVAGAGHITSANRGDRWEVNHILHPGSADPTGVNALGVVEGGVRRSGSSIRFADNLAATPAFAVEIDRQNYGHPRAPASFGATAHFSPRARRSATHRRKGWPSVGGAPRGWQPSTPCSPIASPHSRTPAMKPCCCDCTPPGPTVLARRGLRSHPTQGRRRPHVRSKEPGFSPADRSADRDDRSGMRTGETVIGRGQRGRLADHDPDPLLIARHCVWQRGQSGLAVTERQHGRALCHGARTPLCARAPNASGGT
jgi:hypothetical protein